MDAASLHLLARRLRSIAHTATGTTGRRKFAPSDYAVIEDVALHPNSSIRQITDRTAVVQSLVSRIVARYRDEGILITTPDPADARRVLVTVNPDTLDHVFRPRGRTPIAPALTTEFPHLTPAQHRRALKLLDDLSTLLGTTPRNRTGDN
ncbi:MarR family transcriptional regulator [Nocardia sp. 2]|uniref:MarR family transcriptional regulator n=1 Tax=Nocardia acididurans TaxID=2802282 RepID=A0ABS1MF32_9NOCA|nr:MarR family transcriptional regulator [Nocardia acididurans]MBL1079265.1 MarR family transcriptional regulator [Nocardia acididurans]